MENQKTVVGKAYDQVARFNAEITKLPIPGTPKTLDEAGLKRAEGCIHEELAEFITASRAQDVHGAADALIDLTYFALGRLVEMGIPPGAAFERVHAANMQKTAGDLAKRPGWSGHDAIKPLGWEAPDLSDLLNFTADEIRGMKTLSPAFIEANKIRVQKGKDYNASVVSIADYFPLGAPSFVQMIYVKSLRLVSLTGKPREALNESLRDTLLDLLNYTSYFVEWLDGVLPGQKEIK